jgi:ABC-2 type transport system permease protein
MRNAQVRMMTVMPMILIVVRLMNRRRFDQAGSAATRFTNDFFEYGEGLMATVGVLYVFLILAGLFCNQFAFEHGGMRSLILSPVDRKTILLGKNIAISALALLFSAALLLINELVFRDLTLSALLFVALCWIIFALLMSVMGNSLSIRFPKRMKFGKRLNVSGVVGLLLIPMIILLLIPPLAATAAGYIGRNVLLEYVTLGVLALLSLCFYWLIIDGQGESLQRRELEILEAVNDPGNE